MLLGCSFFDVLVLLSVYLSFFQVLLDLRHLLTYLGSIFKVIFIVVISEHQSFALTFLSVGFEVAREVQFTPLGSEGKLVLHGDIQVEVEDIALILL